jgi:hypothetical protein
MNLESSGASKRGLLLLVLDRLVHGRETEREREERE